MLKVLILLISINFVTNYELLLDELVTNTIPGTYSRNHTVEVSEYKEYVIGYPVSNSKFPYHVSVWGDINTNIHHDPVFIVVRQQKEVKSWEVPLAINSKSGIIRYLAVSRTLCHNNMDIISSTSRNTSHSPNKDVVNDSLRKYLSVSISTSSKIPIKVSVMVNEQFDFYIKTNTKYSTSVTPSQPKYYYFQFQTQDEINNTDTIILEVDSLDDVCLTVSVQQPSCPVEDLDQQILLGGKYQTVDHKGGIIIKKFDFPHGFFVVFVAKGDNYNCKKTSSLGPLNEEQALLKNDNRLSNIDFTIRPGISRKDYVTASLSTLGIISLFYVVFILLTWMFYYFGNKKSKVHTNSFSLEENRPNAYSVPDASSSTGSDEIDARLAMSNLMLSDLAKKGEKYVERKSETYLWHVVSIALFYGIPVVQLVVTYQRVVNISGNQDICYYNFLCAHPLFGLSDFNHVFSNIGYVFVGALFLGIVCYKQNWVHHNSGYGIPKHFGLFYAMGVALIMEGVLSACYHICPNQSNFQFDTSFMYVMAVLSIVKIYQNRHPDINVTAYSTFVVLGMAIFIAMIGILNGHIVLWIIFIILYAVLCIYISFNVYFLSYIKRGVLGIVNEYQEDSNISNILIPKRKVHFRLLLIANIINITLASLGFLCYYLGTDFATYLLGLLMGNVILYLIVYITMKLIHHEKICIQAIIYCFLSMVCWAGGTYFFINNSTAWTVTAAESRIWNRHCSVLSFYDFHDIWHLLSAPALFFSFMILLCIDDDLVNVRQSKIAVF